MSLSVEKIDDMMSCTVFHNVLVLLMTGTMKPTHAELVSRHIEELLRTNPRGVIVASMTAASVPAPTLEVRRAITGIIDQFGERMLLAMPIVDERGVFAAARRAFMRGLVLLLGRQNFVVAGSIDEAVRHVSSVAKKTDGTPVPERELASLFRSCERYLAGEQPYSRLS